MLTDPCISFCVQCGPKLSQFITGRIFFRFFLSKRHFEGKHHNNTSRKLRFVEPTTFVTIFESNRRKTCTLPVNSPCVQFVPLFLLCFSNGSHYSKTRYDMRYVTIRSAMKFKSDSPFHVFCTYSTVQYILYRLRHCTSTLFCSNSGNL